MSTSSRTIRLLRNLWPLALLLFSCTYASQGIFYGIEKEERTPDAGDSLPNSVVVSRMDELSGRYYVAARVFFTKALADASWSRVDISSKDASQKYVLTLLKASANLLIITTDALDGNRKLWTASDPTAAWTDVTSVIPSGESPVALLPCKDTGDASVATYLVTVAASVNNPALFQYKIYTLSNPSSPSLTLVTTNNTSNAAMEQSTVPVSAAFDGANYYLAFPNLLLAASAAGGPFQQLSPTLYQTTNSLGGLIAVKDFPQTNNTTVLLSDSSGNIYFNLAATGTPNLATSWTRIGDGGFKKTSSDSKAVSFSQFAYFNPGTAVVLVGSQPAAGTTGLGYFEVVYDANSSTKMSIQNPTITIDANNYTPSDLALSQINLFFRDSQSQLFIGTAGKGLWSRDNSNKKWSWQ